MDQEDKVPRRRGPGVCGHEAEPHPPKCSDCLHESRIAQTTPACLQDSSEQASEQASSGSPGRTLLKRRQPLATGSLIARQLREANLDALAARAQREPSVVTHLVRNLYHPEAIMRWRAADALGRAASGWFVDQPARAQQLLQRLSWGLNDESGTVGWGIPQAIGEVVRADRTTCERFGPLLASWLGREEEVALGNDLMIEGVIYALGRVAEAHPDTVSGALPLVRERLRDPNPSVRALSAQALSAMASAEPGGVQAALRELLGDPAQVALYREAAMSSTTVGEVAAQCMKGLGA